MSTILAVDDDESILTFITESLNNEYLIHTATSVSDAEGILSSNNIDLLITDLVMPDKNGIDMIMQIKKSNPHLSILAISGGGGMTGRYDYLPIAKLVGAELTLKKPFTAKDLRESIQKILESTP